MGAVMLMLCQGIAVDRDRLKVALDKKGSPLMLFDPVFEELSKAHLSASVACGMGVAFGYVYDELRG